MNSKKPFHKRLPIIQLIGLLIGAIAGYIYYIKVGCASGTCPLTSNPWITTLWGAIAGYLVFDIFAGKKKRKGGSGTEEGEK